MFTGDCSCGGERAMRRTLKIAAWCVGAVTVLVFVVAVGLIGFRAWVNTTSADRVLRAKIPTVYSPPAGSVNGTVTNEEGKIVVGATVVAEPADRPIQGVAPTGMTQATGHFAIHNLRWGVYAMSASKVDEGYPEMIGAFFAGNRVIQKVNLEPENPTATVTIRLGPKAGKLIGTVKDDRTSAPLNTCADFRWAANPGNYIYGTGLINAHYSMLIPSNMGILWKVWADGHKPWYYPGTTDQSKAAVVRLRPGEVRSIAIRLQPDATAEKVSCGMPVGTIIRP